MIKFLDLSSQYQSIKEEVNTVILKTIEEAAFIGGERVANFEKEFAAFQSAEYCVGVGNGTDALEIALEALDLPAGSEVLVPANSFIASSEAVTRSGLKVVFVDNNEDNYTIDLASVRQAITAKTSAIMVVHLYGHPCDMDGILSIAKEYNLKVIEDCAQAHGAEFKGKRIGALGDVGTFSFYPGKNLGAYGDGGAIVTNNKTIAERSRMIANHGRKAKYDHSFEGRNSRLDGLQAAVLSVKLKYLEKWTQRRIDVANLYLAQLRDVNGITLPVREDWARQVYHLFVIRVDDREKLKSFLAERQIQSGVHYPIALPKLEAYQYLEQDCSSFNACGQDSHLLSLPIGEHLTETDVLEVVSALKEYFS